MIINLYNSICAGTDVRQNLSALRKEIKDEKKKKQLLTLIEADITIIENSLYNEDAKTRKNAALLVGDLQNVKLADAVFNAYLKENTRFVKNAMLETLSIYNCAPYLEELKNQLAQTCKQERTIENAKHIKEELHLLRSIIYANTSHTPFQFQGFLEPVECILMTNKEHLDITKDQIENSTFLPYKSGVRVLTKDFDSLLSIRTYKEILFLQKDIMICPMDAIEAAKKIAESSLSVWLFSCHKKNKKESFSFRVDFKSKLPLSKRSAFCKTFAMELEDLTDGTFINSPSNYQIEIRFVETKSGTLNTFLKLHTIPDKRFSYRKCNVPTSIKPHDAAIAVALAKPYMKKDAQVLDPFCGVGTMLIERQNAIKANTSYGIDIYKEAIEGARQNTDACGQIIHYVAKDFFDFTHKYKFNEVFTNMPFSLGDAHTAEMEQLHHMFFSKIRSHLEKDALCILYSHTPSLVYRYAKKHKFTVIEDITVKEKENIHLLILKP